MMNSRSGLAWLLVFCCSLPLAAQAQAQTDADAADRYTAEGQQAMAAGRYGEARTDFEQLVKLEPEVAEVHATLGVIYFTLHEYQLAVSEVRVAQKLKPGLPRLDSLLGLSLGELGRYTEALPRLEKGFKQTADTEIRRMCGLQLLRAYTGLGRDSDAVQTSLELNRLYPDDPEVLYHTGRIYGNFAYVVMEKLHDKAPGSIWMVEAQGEASESTKAYDEAIFSYNRVLQLDPQHSGVHYRLGRIHLTRFREGQKPEERDAAAREFAAELGVDPGNGNAAYELAVMQQEQGNLDEARAGFERVLERFPNFEEALVGLGGVYLDSQKPEQAVRLLERATKVNPGDDVAWYRLARAERAMGNTAEQQKALAVFEKLRSAKPLHKPVESDEVTPQQIGPGTNSN